MKTRERDTYTSVISNVLKKERPEKSNLMLRLLKKTLGRCLKRVNADRIQYSFHDSHSF